MTQRAKATNVLGYGAGQRDPRKGTRERPARVPFRHRIVLLSMLVFGLAGGDSLRSQMLREENQILDRPTLESLNALDLVGNQFGASVALGKRFCPFLVAGSYGGGATMRFDSDCGSGWTPTIFVGDPAGTPRWRMGDAYLPFAGYFFWNVSGAAGALTLPFDTGLSVISGSLPAVPQSMVVRPALVAVGMPSYNQERGRVTVFREVSAGVWEEEVSLDGLAVGGLFGAAVELNEAGTALFVGTPGAGGNGVVEVYAHDGASWTYFGGITPPSVFATQTDADFGASLDYLDGWLAVGAPLADKIIEVIGIPADDVGSVLLYEADNFGYAFRHRFQDLLDDNFLGTSVALGQHGDRLFLVAGAPGDDQGAPDTGSARIYRENPSGVFEPAERLRASDRSAGDRFGFSVAAQASMIAIGAPLRDYSSGRGLDVLDVGAVYIFHDGLFADGFESGDVGAWSP